MNVRRKTHCRDVREKTHCCDVREKTHCIVTSAKMRPEDRRKRLSSDSDDERPLLIVENNDDNVPAASVKNDARPTVIKKRARTTDSKKSAESMVEVKGSLPATTGMRPVVLVERARGSTKEAERKSALSNDEAHASMLMEARKRKADEALPEVCDFNFHAIMPSGKLRTIFCKHLFPKRPLMGTSLLDYRRNWLIRLCPPS